MIMLAQHAGNYCTQNIFQLRVMLLSARVLKIAIHQFRSSKVYHGYFIFPIYL